ncbi:hypothetical protein TEA_027567 [Camellia sinensis var. sinensis]|uniref:Uncharacterized protein n=1 Tax=Camellia sinensis var. sinensis TaxID=542762 RepID=A0A4S4F1B6_CAMSN|nr:hypothetical protein TEA_027567 [Camellia sinensis var. sinensis]
MRRVFDFGHGWLKFTVSLLFMLVIKKSCLGSASHCNVTVDIDIAMTTGTTLQDQKKRTLDALQRRFALAEAELHLQQQKNKKRPHEENKGTTHNVNSSSANVTDALPSSNASSKKGKFSFSGHAATQDVEANDSTYFQLSHPVHENLLPTSLNVISAVLTYVCLLTLLLLISDRRGSIVNQVVHDLLQSGDSAQKYMQGSRSMKIDNWILLDNLVQGRGASRSARIRALKTHSKRSKKHMSMKQHKKCGTLDLPQELHKHGGIEANPLNGEAAALMMRDKTAYEQRVKEFCQKYAKPEDVGAAPEEKSSDDEEMRIRGERA